MSDTLRHKLSDLFVLSVQNKRRLETIAQRMDQRMDQIENQQVRHLLAADMTHKMVTMLAHDTMKIIGMLRACEPVVPDSDPGPTGDRARHD